MKLPLLSTFKIPLFNASQLTIFNCNSASVVEAPLEKTILVHAKTPEGSIHLGSTHKPRRPSPPLAAPRLAQPAIVDGSVAATATINQYQMEMNRGNVNTAKV
jgi:hypothetical protein